MELNITYKGHDGAKDDLIRDALGDYSVGSGYSFFTWNGQGTRDHQAEVDPKQLAAVVRKLKKIPRLTIKKLVKKWVVVR